MIVFGARSLDNRNMKKLLRRKEDPTMRILNALIRIVKCLFSRNNENPLEFTGMASKYGNVNGGYVIQGRIDQGTLQMSNWRPSTLDKAEDDWKRGRISERDRRTYESNSRRLSEYCKAVTPIDESGEEVKIMSNVRRDDFASPVKAVYLKAPEEEEAESVT